MGVDVAFFLWQLTISNNAFRSQVSVPIWKTIKAWKTVAINMIKFMIHQSVATHRYMILILDSGILQNVKTHMDQERTVIMNVATVAGRRYCFKLPRWTLLFDIAVFSMHWSHKRQLHNKNAVVSHSLLGLISNSCFEKRLTMNKKNKRKRYCQKQTPKILSGNATLQFWQPHLPCD